MNNGKIVQSGSPQELYQILPMFVARFIGLRNLIPATDGEFADNHWDASPSTSDERIFHLASPPV
jgi:ABC-type Fe3+/spermidine/putrescine transport system ATPase subunit